MQDYCRSCGGSGIYVGLGERDGAGVVCHTCKGVPRSAREGITRVFLYNPGILIGVDNAKGLTLGLKLCDFGGMPIEDWLALRPFVVGTEMRQFSCPAWYYQAVNEKLRPRWHECAGTGTFSKCSSFGDKAQCWARWDDQFGRYLRDGLIEADKFSIIVTERLSMPADEDLNPVI